MIIPKVTQCKYLGVIISHHNCDLDLKSQMKKFYTNANMLIRKFFKCTVDVKCYLFKTYCSILYCSAMWFDSTKSPMKMLKVAYTTTVYVDYYLCLHIIVPVKCLQHYFI